MARCSQGTQAEAAARSRASEALRFKDEAGSGRAKADGLAGESVTVEGFFVGLSSAGVTT
jgi:hypothetical protein